MGNKKFWTEEKLAVVKKVYSFKHVTRHIIAMKELKKRGINITLSGIQAVFQYYKIPKPYIMGGPLLKGKKLEKK